MSNSELKIDLPTQREAFERDNPDIWKFFIPIPSLSAHFEEKNAVAIGSADSQKEEIGEGQEKWGKSCDAATKIAVRLFDKKDPRTLNLVDVYFKILAPMRQAIGKDLKHAEPYGLPRVFVNEGDPSVGQERAYMMSESVYPFGKYKTQYEPLKARILELKEQSNNQYCNKIIHQGERKDEKYEVTEIGIIGKGLDEKENEIPVLYGSISLTDVDGAQLIRTDHMRSESVMSVLRYADKFYQEILKWKKGDDPNILMRNIGLLAWHLAHAMPLQLGSASTTEMLISTLLQSKCEAPIRFKQPIAWDFLAFSTPNPEDFANFFCEIYKPNLNESVAQVVEDKKEHVNSSNLKIPENENLILCHNEFWPLLMNEGIKFSERCPNVWRTPHERLLINHSGYDRFVSHVNYSAEDVVRELRNDPFFNKKKFLGMEKVDLSEKIKFLTDPKNCGMQVLTLKLGLDYLQKLGLEYLKNSEKESLHTIKEFINKTSLSKLKKWSDKYIRSQAVFNWIDNLPYPQRIQVCKNIKTPKGKGMLKTKDLISLEKLMQKDQRMRVSAQAAVKMAKIKQSAMNEPSFGEDHKHQSKNTKTFH